MEQTHQNLNVKATPGRLLLTRRPMQNIEHFVQDRQLIIEIACRISTDCVRSNTKVHAVYRRNLWGYICPFLSH
jgi:hypothetical protein